MNSSRPRSIPRIVFIFVLCAIGAARGATEPPPPSRSLAAPPDAQHWEFQEQAAPAEYLGRKCIALDGGSAILKDFEMRDAVIDVDVATPAARGFFGIQFRLTEDGATAEWV